MELDWVLIVVGFGGFLITATIELINLWFLERLYKWSQTAGKRLIGDVIKQLNLVRKNADGTVEKLSTTLSNAIQSEEVRPIVEKLNEVGQKAGVKLDFQTILQGILSGKIGKEDLVDYAPLILNYLTQTNETSETHSDRW